MSLPKTEDDFFYPDPSDPMYEGPEGQALLTLNMKAAVLEAFARVVAGQDNQQPPRLVKLGQIADRYPRASKGYMEGTHACLEISRGRKESPSP